MTALKFDCIGTFLDFVDTSVVVLSGTVSIANTAQYNGGSNIPCQIIGVEVCAVNHFGVRENFDCTTTDAYGSYSVAVNGGFLCDLEQERTLCPLRWA